MTIKELIGKGPDELEKMDDETLKAHCAELLKYAVVGTATASSGDVSLDDDDDDKPVEYDELQQQQKAQRAKTKRRAKERWELEAQRLAAQYGVNVELPKELKL